MKVFDISDVQKDGCVQELASQGADGIILKLGETISGSPILDDKFIKFVNDVVKAGLPYGIYYVSHATDKAKLMEEAQWINDKMAEFLNGQMPTMGVWWDLEVPTVRSNDIWPQLADVILTMRKWWNTNKIGIYAQYSYFYDYIVDLKSLEQLQIPLWVAQYKYYENSLKAEHPELNHVAWQFTTNDETQDENKWYGF